MKKTPASTPLDLPTERLPAVRSREDRPINPQAAHPAILIVDDDPDILTALHDLLEHEGFLVTEVSTCRDALGQVKARNFAAVLLDIGLPDGDGLAALETIQIIAPTLPVIVLTAFATQDCRTKSISRGAFSYLTKPYNRDELRTLLRRAIATGRPSPPSEN